MFGLDFSCEFAWAQLQVIWGSLCCSKVWNRIKVQSKYHNITIIKYLKIQKKNNSYVHIGKVISKNKFNFSAIVSE